MEFSEKRTQQSRTRRTKLQKLSRTSLIFAALEWFPFKRPPLHGPYRGRSSLDQNRTLTRKRRRCPCLLQYPSLPRSTNGLESTNCALFLTLQNQNLEICSLLETSSSRAVVIITLTKRKTIPMFTGFL